MSAVRRIAVPPQSLLQRYVEAGAYVDCYSALVAGSASHSAFVEAFYCTWLFKFERLLLGLFASRPSTDVQAGELARAERSSFAAWRVEARSTNEVLLFAGRTRSWLMVAPRPGGRAGSQLLFGSAVVPAGSATSDRRTQGAGFAALLPFHKVYSRALLLSAKWRISRRRLA